ncbi:hypothetical protein OUZ56_032185 [Daphnia magna]|uniref:Uncharacterized protein n=1 Tax=Daphnia magna TaxID=35525 RepID=A0ABQ9ZWE2_9CRUS|nr:hypothetical protein OUZ56_032185 [Daphnia magna]
MPGGAVYVGKNNSNHSHRTFNFDVRLYVGYKKDELNIRTRYLSNPGCSTMAIFPLRKDEPFCGDHQTRAPLVGKAGKASRLPPDFIILDMLHLILTLLSVSRFCKVLVPN